MMAVKPSEAAELQRSAIMIADHDRSFAARVTALARFLHVETVVVDSIDAVTQALADIQSEIRLIVSVEGLAAEPAGAIARLSAIGERLSVVFVTEQGTTHKQIATHLGEARHLRVTDIVQKPVSDRDLFNLLSGEQRWRQAHFAQRGA